MKTINLQLYLMVLIVLIASICLLSTAIFVIYKTHTQSLQEAESSAKSIDKQLEVQLTFGIAKGFLSPKLFPNFEHWKNSEHNSGLCVHFERPKGNIIRRVCRGAKKIEQWPTWFKATYGYLFKLNHEVQRPITHHDKIRGYITVTSNMETELGQAWHDIKSLMKFSSILVLSLCTLLYFAMGWALRPALSIVNKLEKMANENLSTRLSNFKITEWQRTGQAINHLAENLESTLSDRNQLALKLVKAQEEERRYLTRELHDEFGQSLAGLAAIASSITQTAEQACPQLVTESQTVGRITQHMMELLRNMLIRLHPIDFDNLGLTESLHTMITEWNIRSGSKTRYNLTILGEVDDLPHAIPITLFRITQECLTNISKHSKAKNAWIKIEQLKDNENSVSLTIKDDGIADTIEFSNYSGIGLIGIRERVSALGGQLTLKTNIPSGLIVNVLIPIQY